MLAQVHRSEFWSLHEHCRAYFNFVSQTPAVLPSVLVKILGAVMVQASRLEPHTPLPPPSPSLPCYTRPYHATHRARCTP